MTRLKYHIDIRFCCSGVGVGRGDGTDLSMEIRADGLLIYECRFGENVNCEVCRIALYSLF